ncbi:hypothetical protein IAQ61_006868 [Plenodomus lingam]|uniref:uncharacterized protein n=1 Tax=Leptosphaeria maculans TaxID=5022 RepID=UPI003333B771|nr:hypothetical protein IAQ61_006868 [Plenodomus lingam]
MRAESRLNSVCPTFLIRHPGTFALWRWRCSSHYSAEITFSCSSYPSHSSSMVSKSPIKRTPIHSPKCPLYPVITSSQSFKPAIPTASSRLQAQPIRKQHSSPQSTAAFTEYAKLSSVRRRFLTDAVAEGTGR